MTTNYHTPIPSDRQPANAATFNSPLSEIDTQLRANTIDLAAVDGEIDNARGGFATLDARLDSFAFAGGNVATLTNGVQASGASQLTVDSTTGFIIGARIVYTTAAGLEYNQIDDLPDATHIDLVDTTGGEIADDQVVAMISESEYQAANAVAHAATIAPTLDNAIAWASGGRFKAAAYGLSAAASAAANDTALAAVTAAVDTAGGGTIELPAGTIAFNAWSIPSGVSVVGIGMYATILDCQGTGIAGSEKWQSQTFQDFAITHANQAGTNRDIIDAALGANGCLFLNLSLTGSPGHTRHAIRIRGIKADGTGSDSHNNHFMMIWTYSTTSSEVTGTAIYLEGADSATSGGPRCNRNIIIGGRLDKFSTGLFAWGQANKLLGITFNGPATASAVHLKGDNGTSRNQIDNCYFDGGITGDKITLESTESTDIHHMATIIDPIGLSHPNSITLAGNTDKINYTMLGQNLFLGGVVLDDTDHESKMQIAPMRDDGALHVMGGPDNLGGRVILGGSDLAPAQNYVADNGGASLAMQDGSEIRFVKTADGSAFTKLLVVNSAGFLTFLTGGIIPRRTTNNSASGSLAIDASRGDYFEYTLAGDVTFTGATTPTNGQEITVVIKQASSGGPYTVAFSNTDAGGFKLAGGAYTMTATANKADVLKFVYSSLFGRWVEVSRSQNM